MSAATPTLEEQTRRAWADYAAVLQGLDGPEYDTAEQEAWKQLQNTLRELRDSATPTPDLGVG